MATIAEKLGTKEATVAVGRGARRREVSDPELFDALRAAHALWRKLKDIEAELARAKGLIAQRAEALNDGGATVSLEAGDVRCAVTLRHEAVVPEENVPALRRLLGRRFRDLVRSRVQHLATSRLVAEAPEEALKLLSLRRLSPQFRWSVNDTEVNR